jgi:hypothetical protein
VHFLVRNAVLEMAADSGEALPIHVKDCRGVVNIHRGAGGRDQSRIFPGRDQTARRTDFRVAIETNALKPSTKTTECCHSTTAKPATSAGMDHGETRQLNPV